MACFGPLLLGLPMSCQIYAGSVTTRCATIASCSTADKCMGHIRRRVPDAQLKHLMMKSNSFAERWHGLLAQHSHGTVQLENIF